MTRKLLISVVAGLALAFAASLPAQEGASPGADAASRDQFRQLDQDVQSLKKEVLDLNRDLFLGIDVDNKRFVALPVLGMPA